MLRPLFIISTALFLLIVSMAGCKQKQAPAAMGPPVVPVSVARATEQAVPLEIRVVGTAEAVATVEVRSQVAGQLTKIHFAEGQNVSRGQVLFEIDPRPFQESLRQAEAAAARDRAEIRQAQAAMARDLAQAKNADSEAARYSALVKAGDISQAQHDRVRTDAEVYRESARAAEAVIDKAKAALEADLAAVESARLSLSWTRIEAPFAGRTGSLLAHAGTLVKANDTPLVVLHQVAPIHVTFTAPEKHLADIRRFQARSPLPVRVLAQNQTEPVATGKLALIENQVDSRTGTIRLKAIFDNRDGRLWPGQFVNVIMTLDTRQNATVVPAEAVQSGQQGQFVYVVKRDQSIEMSPVTTGRIAGAGIVIESGVSPGDTVVTDGHLRLFPGARVQPVDAASDTKDQKGSL